MSKVHGVKDIRGVGDWDKIRDQDHFLSKRGASKHLHTTAGITAIKIFKKLEI